MCPCVCACVCVYSSGLSRQCQRRCVDATVVIPTSFWYSWCRVPTGAPVPVDGCWLHAVLPAAQAAHRGHCRGLREGHHSHVQDGLYVTFGSQLCVCVSVCLGCVRVCLHKIAQCHTRIGFQHVHVL